MSVARVCTSRLPRLSGVLSFGVAAALFTIVASGAAHAAQTPQPGQVSGHITGQFGVTLPGVRVTLTSADGAAARSTATDDEGAYVFTAVPPGRYRVTATQEGLDDATRDGVTMNEGQSVRLDFVMQVQVKRETVNVFGRADDTQYTVSSDSGALKTDLPLLETPQSVQIVPRAIMREQNALTLTDAVRNVAGVASDFGFNGSTQPMLLLRGFQASSMTAGGMMSGSSSYYLDGTKVQGIPINMASVQSVEVVKGPATVLYGRSEPGGLVNVVSRPLQTVPTFAFEQTAAQYGAIRTSADLAGPINAGKTLLARVSGSWLVNKSNRDFVEDRLGAFSGSLGWVPNTDTRLTLSVNHSNQRYRNDFGMPAVGNRPADIPWSRQFNDAPELSRIRTTSGIVSLEQRLTSSWRLTARGVFLDSRTRELDIWPYRIDLFTGADCMAASNSLCRYYYYSRPDGHATTHQATVDLHGTFSTGAIRHKVLVGAESFGTQKTGMTYLEQITPVNIFAPVFGTPPKLDTSLAAPFDYEDHNRWTSLYAQDVVSLGGGLQAVAGIRFDATSAIFALTGTEPNAQSFTTPRVGLVWQANTRQSLYAQYQDAVDANNGRDPASGKELDAERSRQVEVGYKATALDGGLNATVAVYQLVKRNRADYSLYPSVQTIGEARSRGLEVDVLGRVTRRLSAMASYALTDGKVTKDPVYGGLLLPNAPRHGGSLWTRLALNERWSAGGGLFVQGIRQGDFLNSFQLPAYGRVDAMLSYAFPAGVWHGAAQLNVNNVLDTRYYSGSHPIVQDWIQPGAPRTVSITFRLER